MADNISARDATNATVTLATQDIAGVHFAKQIPHSSAGVEITQPLTDSQLRATAVPVSGPLTDTQLRATAVPVSGPLTDAELRAAAVPITNAAMLATSAAAGATPVLMIAGGVRQDGDGSLADVTGDAHPFVFNDMGRLKVSVLPGNSAATTGNITASGQSVFVNVSRVSNIVIGMVGTTLSGHNASFEASVNSTNGTDGTWYAVQAVRSNANTIETNSGALSATPAYLWELSTNGYNWLRVRATAHTAGTAAYTLQPAPFATEPAPAAQISGTQPVSGTVTANIGTGAIAAGTNAIGDVGLQARANATGAATVAKIQAAATTNATAVKASAGRVLGWHLTNTSAAVKVVHMHNLTVPPTVGTSVPAYNIVLPANASVHASLPVGISHATGISYSITGAIADLDATAVAANDVVGAIFYA